MKNTITFIRSACLFVCIVFMAQGCQKDNSNSELINFSPAELHLNSNAEFNSQLSEEDMLLQIDTDFNFTQYGLTPNYDFSKIIKIENVDEKHIYIPLMNSSNEMLDLFLGIVVKGKLNYLYFSNHNENKISNDTYNIFYNMVFNSQKLHDNIRVNKIYNIETRNEFLCVGSYSWIAQVDADHLMEGDCDCVTFEEHIVTIVAPCGGGGSGTTSGPSTGGAGGSSGGDGQPRPDEIFDDCIELLGVATIKDIIAAEQYHENCGCNGFKLRSITMTELNEIYEFNNELDEELERCKRDVCKVEIWPTLKAKFNEINLPCMDEQMEMEDLYEQAMLSSGSCNPSMTDLLEELTEISGGSHIVKSDFGYTTDIIIGEELRSQLGYLTNGGSQSGYSTNGGCNSNLEELLNNLTDDQICSLIGLDPGQVGQASRCNVDNLCIGLNILQGGNVNSLDSYSDDFLDCISTIENIGDEVIRIIFDSDPNSILAKENFLNDVEEISEIENGISINGYNLWDSPTSPTPGFFIGQNIARDFDGDPDLSYGTDGDIEIMKERYRFLVDDPIATLTGHMTNLLDIFGASDIGRSYIATFTQNQNVEQYYSADLSKKVFNHVSVNNFVRTFAKELGREIMEHEGILFDMDFIQLSESDRPKFNTTTDNLNGLRILINDTEHTIVNVDELSVDLESGDWNADLYLRIKDNFGLDDADMKKFQDVNLGFTSWWILQHVKGFVPFVSSIKIKVNVSGNFND